MPQLDVSTYPNQIFWILVGFLLLYGLVELFILPGVRSIFRSRDDKISLNLDEARVLQEKAKAAELRGQELIQEGHAYGRALHEKDEEAFLAEKEKRFLEQQKTLHAEFEKKKKDIRRLEQDLEAGLCSHVLEVSVGILLGVGVSIDEEVLREKVELTIKALESRG